MLQSNRQQLVWVKRREKPLSNFELTFEPSQIKEEENVNELKNV